MPIIMFELFYITGMNICGFIFVVWDFHEFMVVVSFIATLSKYIE